MNALNINEHNNKNHFYFDTIYHQRTEGSNQESTLNQ